MNFDIYGVSPGFWYSYDNDAEANLGHQKHTGVYALYDKTGLIYIGHSTRLFDRIKTHEKEYSYAKFKVLFSLDEAQAVEKKLIQRLKPRLNKEYIKTFDTKTKRFNSEIDIDVYNALKIKAAIKDMPVSRVVNDALRSKLKKWINIAKKAG
tara:strand:+ start:681 stop:1136 length:456 start_codon:yes stop_codon:yes gene_type:complete